MIGIYEVRNEGNGKRYVGSSVNVERRLAQHRHSLRRGSGRNRHLQAAFDKYGEEKFSFRPLLVCAENDLIFYEDLVIAGYDAVRNGYNQRIDVTSNRGCRWTLSEEARRNIGNGHRGLPSGMKGKKHTEIAKQKNSLAHTGKKRPPGTGEKIAAAQRGIPKSEDARRRMSEAAKRKFASGYYPTAEARKKMGDAARRYWATARGNPKGEELSN